MAVGTPWQHLEARPGRRTCHLFIKGRNLRIWHLVQPIVVGNRTVNELAIDYRLPADAVMEALAFFRGNEREREELRDAGLLPANP